MAGEEQVRGIKSLKSGGFEVTIQHPLIGRVSRNFSDRGEGARYKLRMLSVLAGGVVPPELTRDGVRLNQHSVRPKAAPVTGVPIASARPGSLALSIVLRHYLNSDTAKIAKSDRPVVEALQNQLKGDLTGINTFWCDAWVRHMKREDRLAPGTIRKKVEALARAVDWWHRREHPTGEAPVNALRLMPKGYSTYQPDDVKPGEDIPEDTKRDRRLHPGEAEKIEAAIQGARRHDRERPWGKEGDRQDFLMLFRLITNTGLRLREAYRLRVSDVKFSLRTIHVRRSKAGRPRDVPTSRQLEQWMALYIPEGKQPDEPIFPFWGGIEAEDALRETSNRLSKRFATLYKYAGCQDITEHDLRHEATCRWMDLKDVQGRWLYRPEEVRRITGHKSVQMFERYLSLRGSDLADRLG